MSFEELNLIPLILRAVKEEGYSAPTPIQEQAIPRIMEGRDVMGCAQTGTGKTAAFALPILQFIHNNPTKGGKRRIRALILTPTRELAGQIADCFKVYGRYLNVKHAIVFGGVSQNPQTKALDQGIDVLVATPGRLLDLMGQGFVDLRSVEIFTLDEADRMLDMGFIIDIQKIERRLPKQRQTLLFSATLDPGVRELAKGMLNSPVSIAVNPSASTVDAVSQKVYFIDRGEKLQLLTFLLTQKDAVRSLVFARTKHGADRIARNLARFRIRAAAIHGDKTQSKRQRALDAFKRGEVKVLVATDVASRGLDIDDVSHVFNFDVPNEPESYVHRIGRTGRAGAGGVAITLCSPDERILFRDVEKLINKKIEPAEPPHYLNLPEPQEEPLREYDQEEERSRRRDERGQGDGGGNRRRPRRKSGSESAGGRGRDFRRTETKVGDGASAVHAAGENSGASAKKTGDGGAKRRRRRGGRGRGEGAAQRAKREGE